MKVEISNQTALVCIGGLRHFYAGLERDLKKFQKEPFYQSSIESVENFKRMIREAYQELQKATGDKTPLELRE